MKELLQLLSIGCLIAALGFGTCAILRQSDLMGYVAGIWAGASLLLCLIASEMDD